MSQGNTIGGRGAGGGTGLEGRGVRLGLVVALVSAVFAWPLTRVVALALDDDAWSHILLIPLVSGCLLRRVWSGVVPGEADWRVAGGLALGGLVAIGAGWVPWLSDRASDVRLSFEMGAYVMWVVAGGFLVLGRRGMASAALPFGLLGFMIPLPLPAVAWLEHGLMTASAWLAGWLIEVAGLPSFRDGQLIELPGIVLRVAPECSGIRSTMVLLVTSLLAGHLFLARAGWKWLLVAWVVPLGVARNALRVAVIGWLCARWGPQMIDSPLHRHGGPVFFALSLIPLLLLALWFRGMERADRAHGVKRKGFIQ